MEFKLKHKDNLARVCEITTAHSTFETPIFMPVGTVGAVKALMQLILKNNLMQNHPSKHLSYVFKAWF